MAINSTIAPFHCVKLVGIRSKNALYSKYVIRVSYEAAMKDYSLQRIRCPHCGNHIFVDVDTSSGDQDYYEDCSACCNPIHLNMHIDYALNKVQLRVDADDEQIF